MATRTEGGAPSSLPLLSPSCSVYRYTDKEIHRPLVRLEELSPHALDKKGQVEKKEAQVMGGRCRHLLTTTTTSNSPPPPPLTRS